ncbi:MAG: hypothetical protein P8X55_05175 [Desulfosarcinaceae bacterium]
MGNKRMRSVLIWQALILILFLAMTFANEVFDLPHWLLGDEATTWGQRSGEVAIEFVIFTLVIIIELLINKSLFQRIKILEGFLPICAGCKKIRNQEDRWEQIENYISTHSLVQFSHSLCPDCQKKYYPGLYHDH